MASTYTSDVEIMNSALTKLGAEHIVTANDNSARARSMKAQYPITRDMMLTSHPWNFAIDYVVLAAVTPKPVDVFDYEFVFQLPANCMRVLETSLSRTEDWEEITGNRIAANVSEIKVKFIKRLVDVTLYTATFGEALASQLAMDTSYTFNQSTAQVDRLEKLADKTLRTARSFDAQVGSVRQVMAEDWLDTYR